MKTATAAEVTAAAITTIWDSKRAAEWLSCHPKTLERHAREGRVPGHFRLGRWYFFQSELEAWLRSDVHSNRQPAA